MGRVGLGQSADGFGWIGSHKMNPRTTLVHNVSFSLYCNNSNNNNNGLFCVAAYKLD